MRQSISSISNFTDRSPIDEALRKSIRQAKSKLFEPSHQTSESEQYGTFGRRQSIFSSQVESKLAVAFKENIKPQFGKLITFANNNFDSRCHSNSMSKNKDSLNQKIILLEETNMELQEVISHLKQQNARLTKQNKAIKKNAIQKDFNERKNIINENSKAKLVEVQKQIQLKEKIITKQSEEMQKGNKRIVQLQSSLRKLQTEYSILEMSQRQSKQRLGQLTQSYESKIQLLTAELSAIRKFIPLQNKSTKKQKQIKQILYNDQYKFKLTKQVNYLKVQNKMLKTKLKDTNKENILLQKKQEQMENQIYKMQEERFKTVKELKKKQALSSNKSRKSFGTSRCQSDKNILKTTNGISRRSSLAKIYNF